MEEPEPLKPMLGVERQTLAHMLREHGEDSLAERASGFSSDEMARIGTLGAYYAFSPDAVALGGSMGGSRALAFATVDVLDRAGRPLHRDQPFAQDAERDRELRRHSIERQVPDPPGKRILDNFDPPPWGPAPAGATAELQRCHALRRKPLQDFSALAAV